MRELRRVTSADFVPSAQDALIPDAVLHDPAAVGMHDLARIQELAGIAGPGIAEGTRVGAGYTNPSGQSSPMSNLSAEFSDKRHTEKEQNIKPGSPEWFRLWFAKPNLTGENPKDLKPIGSRNSLMSVNVDDEPTNR
jgi:hypothetical protein